MLTQSDDADRGGPVGEKRRQELRLLRASIAVMETRERAAHLVGRLWLWRSSTALSKRSWARPLGLVDHLISASTSYVSTDNLTALVTAGLESRRLTRLSTARTTVAALVDPTTALTLELSHVAVQGAPYQDVQILRRSEHFPAVPDLEFEGYEGSALKSY